MNSDAQPPASAAPPGVNRRTAAALRPWWAAHGATVLRGFVALMALLAVQRLAYEFWRLTCSAGRAGAIDLKFFHQFVHRWFAGEPIYVTVANATYPPASHVILWPLLGWLDVTAARWLWAISVVPVLAWLVYLIVRESGAVTRLERWFLALTVLSAYGGAVAIGNGQLVLHVLPMLVAAALLLARGRVCWRNDLLVALMFLVALVKPSLSAPFFWLVLFVPGRWRPAMLIVAGYIGLTLLAAAFQPVGLAQLMQGWLARSSENAVVIGYSSLHSWLAVIGGQRWLGPASALALLALGGWTYRHRHADVWVLLGVTALVARFWTYHMLYDDFLIMLPMVTLFRMAQAGPAARGDGLAPAVMFAVLFLTMLMPARLCSWPPPWNWLFSASHAVVWLATLGFLLVRAGPPKTNRAPLR